MGKIIDITNGRDNTIYIDIETKEGNITISGTIRLESEKAIKFANRILDLATTEEEQDYLPF